MPMPLKHHADRSCERCGKLFNRSQRPSGAWENGPEFQRRKYCSLTCANTAAFPGKQGLLARARKLRRGECEACGATRFLHAHHCDGNQANNSPDNIQTLCTHCHGFWHNVLERRGLPIAGRMPRLFSCSLVEP